MEMELCDISLTDLIKEMKKHSKLVDNNCLTSLGYYFSSQVFLQILEGVHYLHKLNPQIIHRDLKPDNILLKINEKNKSVVKIADFGLICLHKHWNKESDPNIIIKQYHTQDVGDICYAAPEVLDSRKYDTKSDIYSLGIILRQLFSLDPIIGFSDKTPPNIHSNYYELNNLHKSMTEEENADQRPDTQLILNDKHKWALSENDFNSKQHLIEFFVSCDEKFKKSYIFGIMIKLLPKTLSIHRNVMCDECDAFPVIGIRYKCNECQDYDICETCIEKPKAHEETHTFKQII